MLGLDNTKQMRRGMRALKGAIVQYVAEISGSPLCWFRWTCYCGKSGVELTVKACVETHKNHRLSIKVTRVTTESLAAKD